MKKFENAIYVTNTVKEELPEEVLLFIINLVRNLHKEIPEVDYLQVLKLETIFLYLNKKSQNLEKHISYQLLLADVSYSS